MIPRLLLLLALPVLLAGCLQKREVYVLNPDGSGKVHYEARFPIFQARQLRWGKNEGPPKLHGALPKKPPERPKTPPEEMLKRVMLKVIERSSGVEAWRDVEAEALGDDRYLFRGTAYFRDIGRLVLSGGQTETQFLRPIILVNDAGQMVLLVQPVTNIGNFPFPQELTPRDLEAQMREARAEIEKNAENSDKFFDTLKITKSFQLPGPVVRGNLALDQDGLPSVVYDGKRANALWRRLVQDDAWLAGQILSGRRAAKNSNIYADPASAVELFGANLPLEMVVAPEGPLFDYDREVVEAKLYQAALLKALRLGTDAELAELPGLSDIQVAGLSFVYESFEEPRKRILGNSNGRSILLALVGDLPEPAIHVDLDHLGVAVSEEGVDLVPRDQFRDGPEAQLGALDKQKTMLKFYLVLPTPEPREIRRVLGKVDYVAPLGTQVLRYPLAVLQDSAVEKDHILTFEIRQGTGRYKFKAEIGTTLKYYQIKSITFVDQYGKSLEQGWHTFVYKPIPTLTYLFNTPLPEIAELVLEIYEPIEQRQAVFGVENIILPSFDRDGP